GEEASLIAVKELQPAMMNHMEEESDRAIREANYKICQLIRQNNGVRSGSTVAVLYLSQERARACNVGDSRIYFCREDKFIHLSKDHNQAQSLVDMGIIPLEDARHSKERHVLTQHLGIFPDEMEICPHYSDELRLQDGDVFLLCSDGLTEDVEDEVIQKALSDKEKTPEHIRDELVEHAMAAGGKDNITIIVARVHIK
ncbi:MAG: serine/threonine-protein phosphatase, partial [Lachnospiraceae bacterium]|nr:serine/threonine-protein phosphatase [Candidatus Merdinaster equi]